MAEKLVFLMGVDELGLEDDIVILCICAIAIDSDQNVTPAKTIPRVHKRVKNINCLKTFASRLHAIFIGFGSIRGCMQVCPP